MQPEVHEIVGSADVVNVFISSLPPHFDTLRM